LPANPREKLNESHAASQTEYLQNRGPGEHVSVHHVVGAELGEDECLRIASLLELLRLSPKQVHRPHHRMQKYWLYQFLCAVSVELSMATAVGPVERLAFIISYFLPHGLWIDTWCSLCGIIVGLVLARAHLLICSVGFHGVCLYALGALLKFIAVGSHAELFFAQHIWDKDIDLSTVNNDWGKHCVETAASLRGVSWNPVMWGFNGADPSTLTYHVEHSLFPVLSCLHLPKIAPLVQATCREFGVEYRPVTGLTELRLRYQSHLCRLGSNCSD